MDYSVEYSCVDKFALKDGWMIYLDMTTTRYKDNTVVVTWEVAKYHASEGDVFTQYEDAVEARAVFESLRG